MSSRFASVWSGSLGLVLGAIAVRAFTLPGVGCWEGVHPTGYGAAQAGAVVVAILLVVPTFGLVVAVEPRRDAVRWILAGALVAELAAAVALFYYLRGFPTYFCG